MNTLLRYLLAVLSIGLSFLISIYFEPLLFLLVESGLGWVLSTIFIRIVVMLYFTLGLSVLLSQIYKQRKIKNWLVILIGLTVGFGISFTFYPIYDVDYFMQNDPVEIDDLNRLEEATNHTYKRDNAYEVLAFLDVGCSHCAVSAERLGVNYRAGQQIPVHLFFSAEEKDIYRFRERTRSTELTYHMINSESQFIHFSGFQFPSVFVLNPEGEVVYHWIGERMNYNAMDYLLSLEQ